MALRVELDGYLVPEEEHDDINSTSITIRRKDDTNELSYGFSGSIGFNGYAYEYIRLRLIDNPDYLNTSIYVNVYDECCNDSLIFEGKISYNNIDWCEGVCRVNANIVEHSRRSKKIDCLKRTLIYKDKEYDEWYNKHVKNPDPGAPLHPDKIKATLKKIDEEDLLENSDELDIDSLIEVATKVGLPPPPINGFLGKEHPYIRYCIEARPVFLHHWLFFSFVFSGFFLNTLLIIAKVISFGQLDIDLDDLAKLVIGCGEGHPSPLVRDYLHNVCNACGITFNSSIFNDPTSPYYNTVLFHAPNKRGTFQYRRFSGINRPVYTGTMFLDMLSKTFNGDYILINDNLIFERKDRIWDRGVWLDLTDIDNIDILEICYEFDTDTLPAWYYFEYARDNTCPTSNESVLYYDDIVDYNVNNTYPWLKGNKKINIPFGRARFRRDGIRTDVFSAWSGKIPGIDSPAINTILDLFLAGGALSVIKDWDETLLLSDGVASEPKLLIWDPDKNNYKKYDHEISNGQDPIRHARVIKKKMPNNAYNTSAINNVVGDAYFYNWNYFFCEAGDNTKTSHKPSYEDIKNNLYDKFWFIENPTIKTFRRVKYKATIRRSCSMISSFEFGKTVLLPIGGGTIATVEELTIGSTEINITGKV